MIVLESWYYNANRITLLICGLWPYQKKFRYVRAMFILGLLVVFITFQLRLLFVYEYNFKIALKIFSNVFPAILCILQFIAFLIKPKEVKYLLNQICEEWSALKDSTEIEIVKKYGTFTRRLTEALFLCALLSWLFLILMHLIPISINDSAVANESVLRQDSILMQELNKEKYIFSFFIVALVGVFVMATTTTMILAYMRHVCAMLKITRFVQRALDSFKESYFFLIGIGVVSLAINLLHALQAALVVDNLNELAISSFYVIIHFIYIFIGNYGGQTITDHSIEVFKALYHVQWYLAPLQVQKLILFLMLKNTKPYGLVIGGIYVASLEGFITLTSMSLSYFMVIYSTQ